MRREYDGLSSMSHEYHYDDIMDYNMPVEDDYHGLPSGKRLHNYGKTPYKYCIGSHYSINYQ